MKIAAMTVCTVDLFPQTGKTYLGGNSLNFAAQSRASAPEAAVYLIGAVGKDEYGKRISDFLAGKGISAERLYSLDGKTATNQLTIDESGERFGVPGTWDGGVYEGFKLSDGDWDFALGCDLLATHGNNPNFGELLVRNAGGPFIVVDFLDVLNNVPLERGIVGTDVALITATEDLLPRYRALAERSGKLLVVTMGAAGSVAFQGGKAYRQEAIPAEKIVDTTGCGDSYLAALSLSYFKDRDLKKAMEAGARAAALTLGHFGGVGV